MKGKILFILVFVTILLFGSGITYSIFHSKAELNSDQKLAQFVFNAEQMEKLELPIDDLSPNKFEEFDFSVTNNSTDKRSDVTLVYQITIKTFHFLPTVIELFKVGIDEPILVCDESYTRNTDNELVCNSTYQEMAYDTNAMDNYTLKVTFPKEYDDPVYADVVDYIDVNIKSFQKT